MDGKYLIEETASTISFDENNSDGKLHVENSNLQEIDLRKLLQLQFVLYEFDILQRDLRLHTYTKYHIIIPK